MKQCSRVIRVSSANRVFFVELVCVEFSRVLIPLKLYLFLLPSILAQATAHRLRGRSTALSVGFVVIAVRPIVGRIAGDLHVVICTVRLAVVAVILIAADVVVDIDYFRRTAGLTPLSAAGNLCADHSIILKDTVDVVTMMDRPLQIAGERCLLWMAKSLRVLIAQHVLGACARLTSSTRSMAIEASTYWHRVSLLCMRVILLSLTASEHYKKNRWKKIKPNKR